MRRVDLMPKEPARSGVPGLGAGIVVAGVLGIATWIGIAAVHLRHLDAQVVAMERDILPLEANAEHEAQLQVEHERLLAAATDLARLRDPVPPAGLLATLTRLIPTEVSLTELLIDVIEVDGRQDTVGGPFVVSTFIEGIATSDIAIAAMVGRINGSGHFYEVRLDDSHEVVINAEPRYRFRLSMLASRAASVRAAP